MKEMVLVDKGAYRITFIPWSASTHGYRGILEVRVRDDYEYGAIFEAFYFDSWEHIVITLSGIAFERLKWAVRILKKRFPYSVDHLTDDDDEIVGIRFAFKIPKEAKDGPSS